MSTVKGARALRRRLKQLPDAVSAEIVSVLEDGGQKIRAAMQARARNRTGRLIAGVKYKVLPKSLRLQVGLLGTPRGRAKLFYGFILDKGRRAQTVTVRRYKRGARAKETAHLKHGGNNNKSAHLVSVYQMRVRGRAGDHFVSGRYRELRDMINQRANKVFDRALKRIGGGND
ncbi:HK97 gp10 family phage protein [Sphingomonas sp. Leaf257]|jgi:hypothetical protein|uniref:HK97 gp10 family phage protein n=1 Tax=Sphingomonas sp. Leaf257 TaxID=1736309 RepID=UPI0006F80D94|nr:HK97 gp10 family phage protein [Sphingomonas sp. Leaf257]KQO51406.1 hypothetical protein ASF14_07870 [Sphingomonas sp. Leaf257]